MPTLFLRQTDGVGPGKCCSGAGSCFVVAEDRYHRADAAELVEVEYEELPVLVDPHKAMEPTRRCCAKTARKNNKIFHWEVGDKAATTRRQRGAVVSR